MATIADIRTDLVLEIDGTHITPEKFLSGVRAFFAIVSDVTEKVGRSRDAVVWRVRVSEGSSLVGVEPEPGFDLALVAQIAQTVSEGIVQVEDTARVPFGFSERTLRHVRDLANLSGSSPGDDTIVRVWARKQPLPVTAAAAAHVSELLAVEHEDFGSLEGRLETLSGRKGLHFVIYEALSDQAVRCHITNDSLLDQAMANFRKRVEVYGVIKYRKDGKPVSIRVDEIVPFPASEHLPSYKDVHGILKAS